MDLQAIDTLCLVSRRGGVSDRTLTLAQLLQYAPLLQGGGVAGNLCTTSRVANLQSFT